jgi:dUTP pyrophosphatase
MAAVFFVPHDKNKAPTRNPVKGTIGSAGYDLFASCDAQIPAFTLGLVHTGWSVVFPPNTYGLIKDVSSVPRRFGVHIVGGVIDNDYEGEIIVMMMNPAPTPVLIQASAKVAQLIIAPTIHTTPVYMSAEMRSHFRIMSDRGRQGLGIPDTDLLCCNSQRSGDESTAAVAAATTVRSKPSRSKKASSGTEAPSTTPQGEPGAAAPAAATTACRSPTGASRNPGRSLLYPRLGSETALPLYGYH